MQSQEKGTDMVYRLIEVEVEEVFQFMLHQKIED